MLASPHIGLQNPGAFSPLAIASGCKLWVRGSLGATVVTGNLTALADQSGNGNNLAAVGTVPYVASAMNGQPGWSLSSAANNYLSNAASVLGSGSARTVYLVVKATSEVGGPLFSNYLTAIACTYFAGGSAYGAFPNGIYTNSIDGSRNAALNPTISIGSLNLIYEFSCATAPATPALLINGVNKTFNQTSPCNAETGTAGTLIGRWGPGNSSYTGTMVEVIVFDSVLSAAKASLVRQGLGALYGITVV